MATQKATKKPVPDGSDNAQELDQAIDELRGVLRKDASGSLNLPGEGADAFGAEFGGADFGTSFEQQGDSFGSDTAAFGGDFGSDFPDAGPVADARPTFGSAISEFEAPAEETFDAAMSGSGSSIPGNRPSRIDLVLDIPIDVQVLLGTSRMPVSTLMNLSEGSTIGLDKRIGEPVDITVNGRMIGRGEITVLEGDETRFGVRLIEIIDASKV